MPEHSSKDRCVFIKKGCEKKNLSQLGIDSAPSCKETSSFSSRSRRWILSSSSLMSVSRSSLTLSSSSSNSYGTLILATLRSLSLPLASSFICWNSPADRELKISLYIFLKLGPVKVIHKGPLDSRTRARTPLRFDYPFLEKILNKFITRTINLTLC